MFKYFLFSDVHGCATILIESLHEAGFDIFNPNHILIGVGDYFDRGNENQEIYNFLKSIPVERKYLVFGNHDEMLLDYLEGRDDGYFNAEYNGLWNTITNLAARNLTQWEVLHELITLRYEVVNENPKLIDFLKEMRIGFKLDNYIITHAGFKPQYHRDYYRKDDKPVFNSDVWASTPEFIRMTRKKHEDFTFIVGHWHASKLNGEFLQMKTNHKTFKYRNYIGLDACSNVSEMINVYVIETNSKPVAFGNKHTLEDVKKM